MADTGFKSGLALAVAQARDAEDRALGALGAAAHAGALGAAAQLDLFQASAPASAAAEASAPASAAAAAAPGENGGVDQPLVPRRGPGRPFGARSRRTDEIGRFLTSRHGDPLERGVMVAALPILDRKVLTEFAQLIEAPSRFEAFKAWAGVLASVLPFVHQRLASLSVKPAGSPDGEAVILPWASAVDEVFELTGPDEVLELTKPDEAG